MNITSRYSTYTASISLKRTDEGEVSELMAMMAERAREVTSNLFREVAVTINGNVLNISGHATLDPDLPVWKILTGACSPTGLALGGCVPFLITHDIATVTSCVETLDHAGSRYYVRADMSFFPSDLPATTFDMKCVVNDETIVDVIDVSVKDKDALIDVSMKCGKAYGIPISAAMSGNPNGQQLSVH